MAQAQGGLTRREMTAGMGFGLMNSQAAKPPNIVLILSDDHSVPFLGCYGDPLLKTPALDKFASEGMRINKAFTTAPQCVPSRASILTGRSPAAARIARFNSPLPPDVQALPDLLKQRGYFQGVCRRWFHLDGPGRLHPLMKRVFQEHDMLTFARRMDFVDNTGARAKTPEVVNAFFDKKPAGSPYFLWVNFNDPHHVWDKDAVSPPVDPKRVPIPPYLPDLPGMREDLARYYGEVMRMDEEFRWVIEAIERSGDAGNTLILFMGDNGAAIPHGKGSLYDPGLNVPLLARWPGKIRPGAVSDQMISGEDLLPTVLEAVGLPVPKEVTGRSFLPLLTGKPYEERHYIFGERGQHGNSSFSETIPSSGFDLSRCVRSRDWKLIYNCTPHQEYSPVDSARDPGWQQIKAAHRASTLAGKFDKAYFQKPRPVFELFNLQRDPAELDNLAGRPEYAAIEQELKEALCERMIINYDFLPLPLVLAP